MTASQRKEIKMAEYIITETEDFYPLSVLFHENGVGISITDRAPEKIVKMWRMDDPQTDTLLAASTLEVRDGVYTLGDIAVRGDLQGKGYGKVMQDVVFDEARRLGVKELWVCAKEPTFYEHLGWEIVPWDEAPNVAVNCTACGKRGTLCMPEIMRKML
ncbi:MAG: GNAT family N-acetyltransferase [Clostridia bacterium]|nr:GNAT family N-acetyltransferase [Clostridia bacterium]